MVKTTQPHAAATRRADADRNRGRILDAARMSFADPGATVSMAEIARRAGVGMATLYRNFPGRRELLEALLAQDVDEVCRAAGSIPGASDGTAAVAWLRVLADFLAGKHRLAGEILRQSAADPAVLDTGRSRVLAAGRPLILAAQRTGALRDDITAEQILDLVIAVAEIPGDRDHSRHIVEVALDGLRPAPPAP